MYIYIYINCNNCIYLIAIIVFILILKVSGQCEYMNNELGVVNMLQPKVFFWCFDAYVNPFLMGV